MSHSTFMHAKNVVICLDVFDIDRKHVHEKLDDRLPETKSQQKMATMSLFVVSLQKFGRSRQMPTLYSSREENALHQMLIFSLSTEWNTCTTIKISTISFILKKDLISWYPRGMSEAQGLRYVGSKLVLLCTYSAPISAFWHQTPNIYL